MTWVAAASTIYGYGVLYSDTQVTFSDGSTRDLLQKSYPISNFLAAGFAGSVNIGFRLLQSLSDFLKMPSVEYDQYAWDPLWVSNNWAPLAELVFKQAPPAEKELGSRIIIVGVSPDLASGFGAKVYFTRFASPDFIPGIMSRTIKFCSIGSGASIEEYKRTIKPLFRLRSGILRAEVGESGGWARQLGFSISRTLADYPHPGIGRHIHIVIVRRGSISVETNDEDIYPPGASKVEIRMPQVARGYAEFMALVQSAGLKAAGAIC